MIRIACVGDTRYEDKRTIKETLFKLKNKYPDLEISTGGRRSGAETYVRKYALEFGINFVEYNPAHTIRTVYSAFSIDWYGKPYNYNLSLQRNQIQIAKIQAAIIFKHRKSDNDIDHFIRSLDKLGKQYKIILDE